MNATKNLLATLHLHANKVITTRQMETAGLILTLTASTLWFALCFAALAGLTMLPFVIAALVTSAAAAFALLERSTQHARYTRTHKIAR